MEKARKKLASAIDGIRNLTVRTDWDVEESLSSEHCCLSEIVRHGFPDDPRCMDFDPVQRLIAIGASHGCVRILGQPGVDFCLKHDSDEPVLHVQFLGGLVTALRDDTIHLWNYRQKHPEIVNSLKMAKEKVTCVYLPFKSKWLHVGTDKGNIYFVSLATFELSAYVIMWNKAIDLSCRTHPGSVRSICACPGEPSKLLIMYDKGQVVLWNVATREAERFAADFAPVRCICWHSDGKQFMCGHKDGSLTAWNVRKPKEVQQRSMPHSPGESVACRPILHLSWNTNAEGEQVILFTGGMPSDEGALPAMTILRSKGSTTVLEMDHPIVNILPLFNTPYNTTPQLPFATAVLLRNDFLVVDMSSVAGNYPCYESPYATDIHESPVTLLSYNSDCPVDLGAALTLVGRHQRKQGARVSDKPWPVNGGLSRECATGHEEIVITGHEDGSLKFWQASGEHLQILYKLKTSRHFEKHTPEARNASFAVRDVQLCGQSRLLLVTSACGQVSLFRFVKTENAQEIAIVALPRLCSAQPDPSSAKESTDNSAESTSRAELKRQPDHIQESHDSSPVNEPSTSANAPETHPMKVRSGVFRRPAGYQPELVCQIPWVNNQSPERVTATALNSAYGLIAVATSVGLALVDILTQSQIYVWTNAELYNRELSAFAQSGDISPAETAQSTQTPPQSATGSAMPKAFMRLNTELRQRSADKSNRPLLSKAQSVAVPAHDPSFLDPVGNGDVADRNGSLLTNTPSTSSLEKSEPSEYITTLTFISSPAKRGLVALHMILPANRLTASVVVAPTGGIIRLQEQIIQICFLDRDLKLLSGASETFKDANRTDSAPGSANLERMVQNKAKTKPSMAPNFAQNGENGGTVGDDVQQLGVFVSELEIKVMSLPGYHQMFYYKQDIPLVKAKPTHIRGYPALICLKASGHLLVCSLPSLRPVYEVQLFKRSVDIDDPVCSRTDFSEHGLGMYMTSPSEMQKLTVCSETRSQVDDCAGELFVPCDMPEQPKSSFLRGVSTLFTGPKEPVDLEAIYSEKPSSATATSVKSVARQITSSVAQLNMDHAQRQNVSAGQAAAMAIQNLNERSEKLSATIDATEQLRNNAMSLQSRSSKLVEKYEKKKWYQL